MILILIVITTLVASVHHSSYPVNKDPQGSLYHLYQERRGWPLYIQIKEDSAFYKKRQVDKPSWFNNLDTLIRNKTSDVFIGRNYTLMLKDTIGTLIETATRKKRVKVLTFFPATNKQMQQWDSYINIDKYWNLIDVVNKTAWQRTNNIDVVELRNDLGEVSGQAEKLSQAQFDSVLNKFKVKYNIQ